MSEQDQEYLKQQIAQGFDPEWALINDKLRVYVTDSAKDEAIAENLRTGKKYVLTPLPE